MIASTAVSAEAIRGSGETSLGRESGTGESVSCEKKKGGEFQQAPIFMPLISCM